MQKLKQYTLAFLLLLIPAIILAARPSPVDMLQKAADDMIAALKANKSTLQKDPDSVYGIVKKLLLPHVDQETMARSVLGRDTWQKASVAQHKRFVDEYTFLIVRTYSRALASYTDQQVKFFPLRKGYEDKDLVQVSSEIRQKDGPPVPVDYRLRYLNNEWKVYDITVDNVSMIQSYRAQFADKVTQSGFEGLINSLHELNSTKK